MTNIRPTVVRSSGMDYPSLCSAIGEIHTQAQGRAAAAINQALTIRNWLIGAYIVEYEQNGADRAKYGDGLIDALSVDLVKMGVPGASARNLRIFRQVFLAYRIWQKPSAKLPRQFTAEIWQKLSADFVPVAKVHQNRTRFGVPLPALIKRISWSHIVELAKLSDDLLKRSFYEVESVKNNWSVPQLKRQIETLLFERLGLSRDKRALMKRVRGGSAIQTISDTFKDPYVLEFTGLAGKLQYLESDLERALLDRLQEFILELGKGFCFEARQQRVTLDNEHDYVDLVFYHRILRCHVLIDLKVRKFRHSDAGQMNFYLNYYRNEVMEKGDQPPVGLILCTDKDHARVEYATAGMSNKVFVSRYLAALPSRRELADFLRRDRAELESAAKR